jgi:hypothetical protein
VETVRLRADRVTWREVEGEVVALDLQASTYFSANASGSVLWPLLLEGATRTELTDALVKSFDVGPEQAAVDVDAYLASLDELGLLDR